MIKLHHLHRSSAPFSHPCNLLNERLYKIGFPQKMAQYGIQKQNKTQKHPWNKKHNAVNWKSHPNHRNQLTTLKALKSSIAVASWKLPAVMHCKMSSRSSPQNTGHHGNASQPRQRSWSWSSCRPKSQCISSKGYSKEEEIIAVPEGG